MAAANRNLLKGELSDGGGQVDGDGAEAEADCSVGLLDVVDGEPGARAGRPGGWRTPRRSRRAPPGDGSRSIVGVARYLGSRSKSDFDQK